MRSYPLNSPEAAARIVALVLVSDGNVCTTELDALDHLDASRRLGLQPEALPAIVQTLCEDLLLDAYASGSVLARVGTKTIESLMAEVAEPTLQREVFRLVVAAANADRHLADGEFLVLDIARRCWRLDQPCAAAISRCTSG